MVRFPQRVNSPPLRWGKAVWRTVSRTEGRENVADCIAMLKAINPPKVISHAGQTLPPPEPLLFTCLYEHKRTK